MNQSITIKTLYFTMHSYLVYNHSFLMPQCEHSKHPHRPFGRRISVIKSRIFSNISQRGQKGIHICWRVHCRDQHNSEHRGTVEQDFLF